MKSVVSELLNCCFCSYSLRACQPRELLSTYFYMDFYAFLRFFIFLFIRFLLKFLFVFWSSLPEPCIRREQKWEKKLPDTAKSLYRFLIPPLCGPGTCCFLWISMGRFHALDVIAITFMLSCPYLFTMSDIVTLTSVHLMWRALQNWFVVKWEQLSWIDKAAKVILFVRSNGPSDVI